MSFELAKIQELTRTGEVDLEKSGERIIRNAPQFVWIEGFLCAAGSYFYEREDDREPNDIDVIVRADEDDHGFKVALGADLRLKVDRILEARTGLKSSHWHAEPHGPDWRYQPLYDLVLAPHKPEEVREVNEPEFASEFYKTYARDKCMECGEPPEFEILWAEGMAHAWFCSKHTGEFIRQRSEDIDYIKAVDETASIKFQNNRGPNIKDKLIAEFLKLDLPSFRQEGIDDDLKDPKANWKELLADHRYLHIGYYRLKSGKKWGDWTEGDVVSYHAAVISALRKLFFPMIPMRLGEKECGITTTI